MDLNFKPYSLNINKKLYTISEPKVMGILNITNDSFFDGGAYLNLDDALSQVEKMMEEGVDIIDVGGQSTRPGADEISLEDELQRTIPTIENIVKQFPEAIISIDTYRSEVAKMAAEAGAGIVNDISAGEHDSQMLNTVAQLQLPYIAMHKKGSSKTMQLNPQYENICKEVFQYFVNKKNETLMLGINDLMIDVGFGFGKTTSHNFELLKHLNIFHALECPLLVGISRKGMIWKTLQTKPEHALAGTIAANTIALLQGAHIIRVHDVKEAKDAIRIVGMMG